MKTVIPEAPAGQGSVSPCPFAPFERIVAPEPAAGAAQQTEGRAPQDSPELSEAATSLLQNGNLPAFRPTPHFPVEPRGARTLEDAILRSLARRATRTVRPLIQSVPQQELWAMGFNEGCQPVGLDRMATAAAGALLEAPLSMLGWAQAKGARALVLVQNQPGQRQGAKALPLLPTLKVAAAAALFGMILVDHVIIHNAGISTHLRQWRVLAAVRAFAVQLQTDLDDLAASHLDFGLPRAPAATP